MLIEIRDVSLSLSKTFFINIKDFDRLSVIVDWKSGEKGKRVDLGGGRVNKKKTGKIKIWSGHSLA